MSVACVSKAIINRFFYVSLGCRKASRKQLRRVLFQTCFVFGLFLDGERRTAVVGGISKRFFHFESMFSGQQGGEAGRGGSKGLYVNYIGRLQDVRQFCDFPCPEFDVTREGRHPPYATTAARRGARRGRNEATGCSGRHYCRSNVERCFYSEQRHDTKVLHRFRAYLQERRSARGGGVLLVRRGEVNRVNCCNR